VLVAALLAGCHLAPPHYPAFPDAPLELTDESDRSEAS
jgi:hypothetical protein